MRKLLMITSTWNNTYVDSLLQGILRRIQNTDIQGSTKSCRRLCTDDIMKEMLAEMTVLND